MNPIFFLLYEILEVYKWIVLAAVIVSWLTAFNVINQYNNFVRMVLRVLLDHDYAEVAQAAGHGIRAGPAVQLVVSGTAIESVGAVLAAQAVVAVAAAHRVCAVARIDGVIARRAGDVACVARGGGDSTKRAARDFRRSAFVSET